MPVAKSFLSPTTLKQMPHKDPLKQHLLVYENILDNKLRPRQTREPSLGVAFVDEFNSMSQAMWQLGVPFDMPIVTLSQISEQIYIS